MKVTFADRAQKDLDEIAAWIGADNPERAVSFVRELWYKCRSLALHPERFPVVRALRGGRIRKLSHHGYLILYFVIADRVEIARIVHGSRDWVSLLDDGERPTPGRPGPQ